MQKILILALALFAFTACEQSGKKGSFELSGNFSNSKGETIYLEKLAGQTPIVVDSTVVGENGDFAFENYNPKIGFYRVKLNEQSFAMLVLDSADKVKLTGNINDLGNTYKAEGSPETDLFRKYNDLSKAVKQRTDSLQQIFQMMAMNIGLDKLQQVNPELANIRYDSLSKTMEAPYMAIMDQENAKLAEVIKKNTGMFASLLAVQALNPEKYFDIFVELDKNLMKKFSSNQNVLMFHDMVSKNMAMLEKKKALEIGKVAPEIVLPDVSGKELALSSFKGKVVLVDFWASWCGPCRREMPNVVKAYAKYKDKGFEIFGVSLDKTGDEWLAAIKEDGITWPQVSDLKYWECAAAKEYGVAGIPFTVLLDKEGKILAKNLRGDQLDKAIALALAGKPVPSGDEGETVRD
jgi:peroxiredoxin